MRSPGSAEKTLLAVTTAGFFLASQPDPEKLTMGNLSTFVETSKAGAQTAKQKEMLNSLPDLDIGIAKRMISNVWADLHGDSTVIAGELDPKEAKKRQGGRMAIAGLMLEQASKLRKDKRKGVHTELKVVYSRAKDPFLFKSMTIPTKIMTIEVDYISADHPKRKGTDVPAWMTFMLKGKDGNTIYKPVNVELKVGK